MKIIIGTRGSKLALTQTHFLMDNLKAAFPEHEYEIKIIKTTGDKNQTSPLDQVGSKGLFVDEIEQALLRDDIQLAVHSMKDMPAEPLQGLCFTKPLKREDSRDVLILKEGKTLYDLPMKACIATGSKRRSFQLLSLRPDLQIFPIRGNIDTRIKKLHEGLSDGTQLDGIILAAAGIHRLGIDLENVYYFEPTEMVPAPAQGTLAIEVSCSRPDLIEMVDAISDEETYDQTMLERGFLKAMGGDCHLPIGAYAKRYGDGYELMALFGNEDGTKLATTTVRGGSINNIVLEAVTDIKRQLEDRECH